jgi:molybdopterin molybdotransferase
VASEDILSKSNNPAGNNAAFDGYAIASKDTNELNKKIENYLK